MTTVQGKPKSRHMSVNSLAKLSPESRNSVDVDGMVHSVRDMGGFVFLILRCSDGYLQCVYDKTGTTEEKGFLREECAVTVSGELVDAPRVAGGLELRAKTINLLSAPVEEPPVALGKRSLSIALEKELGLRPVTLRANRNRAVFKLREGLVRGIRDYLEQDGFTEIFSPKLVAAGAEGGANIFSLEYFGKKAYLAQSPQFYKQTLVPAYGKVFEIAPVFRAEKHDTARHLNEYISIDAEMGFIDSFYDILEMETGMLKHMLDHLRKCCGTYLKELDIQLPEIDSIPCIKFKDAKEQVSEKYNRKIRDPYDLEPEEERLISRLALEESGSEFVFVTHYPSKKRPFYAMDDPEDPRYTLSFDLLFRGTEITTGGQRIHDYNMQLEKMQAKGLNPEDFQSFLMIHKYGCPPHGGMGMGLERLLQKLTGDSNIRSASMFPRDTLRLEP